MEILILYCDTGGGHHTAALAMEEELKIRGHHVTMMDPYVLSGKHTASVIGNSYIKLVQHSPKSFGAIYAIGEAYDKLPVHSPVYWANGKLAEAMDHYLQEHSFDFVVMTHTFPAQILAHLDPKKRACFKTLLIATDYTCTPFFEESSCDYYGIPSPDLENEFTSKRIPKEKILAYGIPVRREFTEVSGKTEARKNLGRSEEGKCILLSGGSMGAGHIVKAVAVLEKFLNLNREYQLTVICGSNRKVYQQLINDYGGKERIHILGFTHKMSEYLKAADIFITKPGGLSSTEAAICGIPLIHLSPIPGCETSNALYFAKHGMSLYVSQPGQELLDALYTLQDDSRAGSIIQAQLNHISPNAAAHYCNVIES